jgi:hypothetical protein
MRQPDRHGLIQQAMLQVLQERWDPTFSEHSHGFRPGRSAHQAVAQAQRYIAEGYNVVVDLDLEKFLDCSSDCPPADCCRCEEVAWRIWHLDS